MDSHLVKKKDEGAERKENKGMTQAGTENNLYEIMDGPKGRGLFAKREITPRTLIHEAPCIRVVKEEYDKFMQYTVLEHYLFNALSGEKLLALGHGSLFNHSRQPNIDYRLDSPNLCIRYYSGHKTIQKDEELCINYGGHLWFDDTSTGSQETSESDTEEINGMVSFLGRMEL